MGLKYQFVIYIGIPLSLILLLIRFKQKSKYKSGKKIANTKYTQNLPYYKKIMKKYKFLATSIKMFCIISIILSLILIARPVKVESSENIQYNRDIFLCLDVSGSVAELDADIVNELKETVKQLKGERFGVSIFNTSSNLLIPLTEDYEYVLETLDKLKQSLDAYNDINMENSNYLQKYSEAGTLVGNESRGSSIIGDGLASCIYSFPDTEKNRTRIILFATDNDDASTNGPIVTLEEAGKIAKEKNIKVYGICPKITQPEDKQELESAVNISGGKLYKEDEEPVSQVVKEIQETTKSELKGTKETRLIDKPAIPFVILITSIGVIFLLNKKLKI